MQLCSARSDTTPGMRMLGEETRELRQTNTGLLRQPVAPDQRGNSLGRPASQAPAAGHVVRLYLRHGSRREYKSSSSPSLYQPVIPEWHGCHSHPEAANSITPRRHSAALHSSREEI